MRRAEGDDHNTQFRRVVIPTQEVNQDTSGKVVVLCIILRAVVQDECCTHTRGDCVYVNVKLERSV